jgi:hypothetical protein
LLANFFAKVEKLVIDCLLTLNFNLITLNFANIKRLLKTTIMIFLKSFFVLTNLFIAIITREVRRIIDNNAKIKKNINYIDILKALQLHAN